MRVYFFSIENRDINQNVLSCLTDEQLAKFHSFNSNKRKIQYGYSRVLLNEIFSANKISEARIKSKKNGKLECRDNFYFSLSHSGNFIVVATSFKSQVGIDIETKILPIERQLKIFKKHFSHYDYSLLSHTKNPSSFFKRLWSLKEAYFKLNDSITTNRIKELQFDWKKNCFYFNGVSDKSVCRFMYMENKRYCLAIAQSEKEDIEYYDVKYEDTLKMYQKHCSFQSLVPSPMEEI